MKFATQILPLLNNSYIEKIFLLPGAVLRNLIFFEDFYKAQPLPVWFQSQETCLKLFLFYLPQMRE